VLVAADAALFAPFPKPASLLLGELFFILDQLLALGKEGLNFFGQLGFGPVELILLHWSWPVNKCEEVVEEKGPLAKRQENHKENPTEEIHERNREDRELNLHPKDALGCLALNVINCDHSQCTNEVTGGAGAAVGWDVRVTHKCIHWEEDN
jgi:hypothetical protein